MKFEKIFFFLLIFSFVVLAQESVSLEQQVIEPCDHDLVCEIFQGENSENCPSDCPPSLPGQPIFPPLAILDLKIFNITHNSATISWKTNKDALCQIFVGKTKNYEIFKLEEKNYISQHTFSFENLLPDTKYFFKIFCQTAKLEKAEVSERFFFTLPLKDFIPPTNPIDFEALAGDSQILLRWKNPPDPDFKLVKIFRSTKFYPQAPFQDAILIYEGKENSFLDKNLKNYVKYFYTAVAVDEAGNFSSGALAWAIPLPLSLQDFQFVQEGEVLPIEEERVKVKANLPFLIYLPIEKVPAKTKSIILNLKDKKETNFFFQESETKTFYFTKIQLEPGEYSFFVYFLDAQNRTLKQISGKILAYLIEVTPTPSPTLIPSPIISPSPVPKPPVKPIQKLQIFLQNLITFFTEFFKEIIKSPQFIKIIIVIVIIFLLILTRKISKRLLSKS